MRKNLLICDCADYSIDFQCNHSYGFSSSKPFEPSAVSVLSVRNINPEGVPPCFKKDSDVKMLMRVNEIQPVLGSDTIKLWLNNMENSYRQSLTTSGYDDELLLKFVKSRNIQSSNELLAWSNYLCQNSASIIEKLKSCR